LDGLFLHGPELRVYWGFSIFRFRFSSPAAKKLNRAQSAVIYGIQKLEAADRHSTVRSHPIPACFDRGGAQLVLRARRIAK
jgi:DNA-binding transcriptional LysR family regulator